MSNDKNWRVAGKNTIDFAIYLIAFAAALQACTPSFNWRTVSLEPAPVQALLPCKPDRGARSVRLAGQEFVMHMAGCKAAGAMFTVATLEVRDAQQLQAVAADLKAQSKATHGRVLMHGRQIALASIYGQPQQGSDGPSALSVQAVETFLTSLQLAGAK